MVTSTTTATPGLTLRKLPADRIRWMLIQYQTTTMVMDCATRLTQTMTVTELPTPTTPSRSMLLSSLISMVTALETSPILTMTMTAG